MIYSNGGAIGRSFAPTTANVQQVADAGGAAGGPTQAIQTLNLRYPRVVGAGSIAPSQLLNAPGSAGLPQQNARHPIIEAILRAVMGGFGSPQQAAPSAMGGQSFPNVNVPIPRVTPGVDKGSQAPLVSRPPYVPPVTRPNPMPHEDRPTPGRRQGPDNFPGRQY